MTDLYLQTGIALAAVIGAVYLLGFVMKKRQTKDGLMQIVGWQSLGPKKGLAVVKVGPEVLLMAVTAADVKLLKTLDGAVLDTKSGPAPKRAGLPAASGISDKLNRLKALKDSLKDANHAVK